MWRGAVLLAAAVLGVATPAAASDAVSSSLRVGRSVDIFSRYAYFAVTLRVVPKNDSNPWIFREPAVDVFADLTGLVQSPRAARQPNTDFQMQFCDDLKQLMQAYFRNYTFEDLEQPWRAFTATWQPEITARYLGINASFVGDDFCYILVRLSRLHESDELANLPNNVQLVDAVADMVNNVHVDDVESVLTFIRKYGTHYISSYSTGNAVFQVYVFDRQRYNFIKNRLKSESISKISSRELLYYFSPYEALHIGRIMVASDNKTVVEWASTTLRTNYFVYTFENLLKLHGHPALLRSLLELMGNEALLQIELKSISAVFKDPEKRLWFEEVFDNTLKMWEVNV